MENLPHRSERAMLPSIRPVGEEVPRGKVLSSKGTPVAGETLTVFTHIVEIIAADGNSSQSVEAIVDTGASYLTVPQEILRELGILAEERVPLRLADGSRVERDLGEAKVRIMGRTATTNVIFGTDSDRALLGSHALEAVRLGVDPWTKTLVDFTPFL